MGQISIDFQNKPSINAEYTRLTLHEYISKPFKAVIDCNINKQSAGSKSEFISNPLSYINEYVYIKVFQKYNSTAGSYRYISGKITNILYKGILKKDDKNNIYLYEITIQPPFVELMKAKKSKSYLDKNIKDIIQEILDENNIGSYDLNDIDGNNLIQRSSKILINQHNETDYEFLMRLLLFYGINYYFIHINKNSEEKTTLRFTSKIFSDVKFMNVDDDNRHINKLYLNIDNNDKSAGVFNNVMMNYNSYNADIASNAVSLHGFGYGNNTEAMIQEWQDKEDIRQNIEAALSYKKNTILLSSTYICAGINSKINIKGYMPDENTANDMYLIKSVTTVYNNGSNEKDNIDIYGFFVDNTKKSNGIISEDIENTASLYFNNNMASKVSLFANNMVEPKDISNNTVSNIQSMLLPAVVCDKNGNTDVKGICIPENCDKDNPDKFYAKLNNESDKARIINIVLPYGAKNYYTFTYPEIGSEILVFKDSDGKYYLFGYTPNISTVMSSLGSLKNSYLYTGTAGKNYIYMDYGCKNQIKNLIHSAAIDSFMQEAYTYINMTCLQNDYENTKAVYKVNGEPKTISVKEWCAALKTKYDEQINAKCDKKSELENLQKKQNKDENQINTIKQDIDNLDKSIQTIESEIAQAEVKITDIFANAKNKVDSDKDFSDKEAQKTKIDNYIKDSDRVNIYSSAVDVNGKDSVDIKSNSRLNLFANSNGIEISSTDDTIHLKAKKLIRLSVGSNFIEIDEDRVSLVARKWMTSAGPTDSSIFLESVSGVDISGLECSMNGLFSSSMSDSFGGTLKTYIGSSSIHGYKSGIYTLKGVDGIVKSAINAAKLIFQFGSINANAEVKHGMDIAKYICNSGQDAYGIARNIEALVKEGKPENKADKILLAMDILEMIFSVMDRVVTIMELEDGDYMHDDASPNSKASKRDALRLFLMTSKITMAILIFTATLMKVSSITKSGKMEFAGTNGNMDFNRIDIVTDSANLFHSPGAGVVEPDPSSEGSNDVNRIDSSEDGNTDAVNQAEHPATTTTTSSKPITEQKSGEK